VSENEKKEVAFVEEVSGKSKKIESLNEELKRTRELVTLSEVRKTTAMYCNGRWSDHFRKHQEKLFLSLPLLLLLRHLLINDCMGCFLW